MSMDEEVRNRCWCWIENTIRKSVCSRTRKWFFSESQSAEEIEKDLKTQRGENERGT